MSTAWDGLCDRYAIALSEPRFRRLYWRAYPNWRDEHDGASMEDYVLWLAEEI